MPDLLETAQGTTVREKGDEGIALLQRMWARRSTPPRHLMAPGPTDDEILMLVRATSRAPDHLHLKPFHFMVIRPDARDALADVFEAAELELDPAIGSNGRGRRPIMHLSSWP